MEKVLLTSICRPKQWKTISSKDLLDSGYPVYGANGKIGFYNSYTHEYSTVLITCRGATCGSINISDPKSYVNGNAMALDNLSEEVDLYYLKYYLEYRKLDDVISGSAQPQITGKGLSKVKIPLPPLDQQKKIAAILDAADAYRQKTKALIEKYDELTQSLFLNMFGDPVTNPKGWEFVLFKELIIKIENGWSPVCENFSRISNDDWAILKLGAVSKRFYDFSENKQLLPENKPKIELKVSEGDLLFVRKNTYEMVGASAYVFSSPGNLMIPDTIFRLKYIESKVNPIFLWLTINHENYRQEIQRLASGSAGSMPNISKSRLMNKKIYLPPVDKQNQFAERVQAIEAQKTQAQASLAQAEDLFNSLLQKAFKGDLA